jgi:hypothetical protein
LGLTDRRPNVGKGLPRSWKFFKKGEFKNSCKVRYNLSPLFW